MNKRYFHTFDALRFFAFLKVFLLHLPIFNFAWFNFIRSGGGIGVQFFFVLSGFLISYLILEEKSSTNNFNLKNFFARRILRTWPLYFIMVGFAYSTPFVLDYFHILYSDQGYEPDWRYSVFFLENYKSIIENNHPNVSPLVVMWSLCIEEHFYLVWGLLLFFLPVKAFPKLVFASVAVSLIARKIFFSYGLRDIDLLTNLDLFAIGGLLAYLLITRNQWVETKTKSLAHWKKVLLIFIVATTVVLESFLFNNYIGRIIQPTVFGILFTLLLAIFIPENSDFKIGGRHPLSRWGKLSYGLYLFHTIIINLLLKIFSSASLPLDNVFNAMIFILIAFVSSLLCSQLSFILIERPFLKIKKFFYPGEKKYVYDETDLLGRVKQ